MQASARRGYKTGRESGCCFPGTQETGETGEKGSYPEAKITRERAVGMEEDRRPGLMD